MFPLDDPSGSLESVAHIIQVALTPVFLLSGLASLLGVFSTRLARVADKVDHLSEKMETAGSDEGERLRAQFDYLRRRSLALDAAVVLGALGGGATCAAVLALLLGLLWETSIARVLFTLFGLAVVFTLGALIAFVVEMLMAGQGLRAQARRLGEACSRGAKRKPNSWI